jgi:hypothetical protein
MKGWQLIAASVLYLWAAKDYAKDGQPEDAVAWLCYALANCAFAWRVCKPDALLWFERLMAR